MAVGTRLSGKVYVVRPGDCLSVIAARYGTSWPRLAEVNRLANPDLIYPGQVLQIV
ncbi:LysM peptidoglycan-binding domain-containing protein [Candidatus Solirubrobacter pratensis]|uniref:LysM peptidoglycan-binding domain-containing protein n=1 Tax=Candidatus Solirubrobacter pratensis TaxID=1298857 RepID=UPI0003FAC5AD|nr:LysM domain-containing protein [Candidatus Solirubrobacter pratensis]